MRLAREGFADRQYEDDGNLASRSIPGTVIKDPAKAAEQVLRMVRDGEVVSRHGKTIKVKVDTVCVHGDEPTAVEVAGAVRKRLEDEGIAIVPLTEMKLGVSGVRSSDARTWSDCGAPHTSPPRIALTARYGGVGPRNASRSPPRHARVHPSSERRGDSPLRRVGGPSPYPLPQAGEGPYVCSGGAVWYAASSFVENLPRFLESGGGRLPARMTDKGVGARLPRKEDDRFLRGRGEYVANIRLPGMLDVAFVRSPMAHGKDPRHPQARGP